MARRLKHRAEKEKVSRSVNCPSSLQHGWVQARVGDILKIRNGYAVKSSDYSREGIPLIRQSDINGDTIDISAAKRVPARVMEEYPQYLVRKGDLLIGMSGSLGKIGRYVEEEVAIQNQRTGLLQVKPGFTAGFAKLVLNLVEQQIIAEGKGVAVQNVSAKEIEDCTFPLPPEGERERIVAETEKQFTRLDAGMASLKRVQIALKRSRASVLKAACEGRPWPRVPLGDVVSSMKNGIYKPRSAYADAGIACLRMYNIESGTIVWKNIKRMTLSSEDVEEYRLVPGDLLVNRVNSRELVGKAAPIPHGLETCVFESKNIRLRLRRELAVPKFIGFAMSVYGQAHFNRNAQQVVGMASISQPQVGALEIPLPPLTEQTRIVAEVERRLSVIEELEAVVSANLQRATRLRQSILQRAFDRKLILTSKPNSRRAKNSLE